MNATLIERPHIQALKEAIRKAGGTQTQLADRADCSQQIISDVLKGRRKLSPALAIKISRATRIPRSKLCPEFFGGVA